VNPFSRRSLEIIISGLQAGQPRN